MNQLLLGDCLEILPTLADESVDSIVTDPPYGWRFMGKAWDDFDIKKMAKDAKGKNERICADGVTRQPREKPAEAAGKYDMTLTGNQAFQKFTEDWARQAFRVLKPGGHMLVFCGPRTYHRMAAGVEDAGFEIRDQLQWLFGSGFPKSLNIEKAGAGEKWSGWGTALKPANEPICLARKPLSEKTVAANVLKHGTGGLNIDGTRIEGVKPLLKNISHGEGMFGLGSRSRSETTNEGRFPSNVIFDEAAAEVLDEQSGILKSGAMKNIKSDTLGFHGGGSGAEWNHDASSGGASRFFYVAKASKSDRGNGNTHPTVKPIKLMEYLIKLVTPPGGTVLDPFAGSGTTGIAAANLGFDFIGIELNAEYFKIAETRVCR